MYNSLRRRGGSKRPADARGRQVPAGLYRGSREEVLRRHERESAEVARGNRKQWAEFAAYLFPRTITSNNLMSAIDHLVSDGGDAPGPNGTKLLDLDVAERWRMARGLEKALSDGTYSPGPHREVEIPKGTGRGTRTLKIQDVEDRVVQRAILQIVQPLIDPRFAVTSYGYRPNIGPDQALAKAEALAVAEGRWIWVLEDVRDAFEQVPHGRLLDVLRLHAPAKDFLGLVGTVIHNNAKRGLRQGGSLSPLLLNVYLDHHLDRPWAKAHPNTPLIRYADDLLVLARDAAEARDARQALLGLLGPAAMPLKESARSTIRDLGNGDVGEWMGGAHSKGEAGLVVRLAQGGWDRLDERLAKAHRGDDAPVQAIEAILGWVGQRGPCYPHVDVDEVHARIVSLAREHAFEELPTAEEVRAHWVRAHDRWEAVREGVRIADRGDGGGGSASRDFLAGHPAEDRGV